MEWLITSKVGEEDYDFLNEPRIKTVEEWITILNEEKKYSGFNFIENVLIEAYNSPNKTIFCHDLEKKLNISGINLRIGEFRDRIKRIDGIKLDKQIRSDSKTDRAWNIPFTSSEEINNLPENKGKFCWILRDELSKAMELVIPNLKKNNRILFCNIAYMDKYDNLNYREIPINGGKYVEETKDAFEKYNYHICKDQIVRGFVETKYTKGAFASDKKPKQLHIERIENSFKNKDVIDNVLVVFCSQSPIINKKVIVGWYKDAKVYRGRMLYNNREYNLETNVDNAILLDETERVMEVPLASSDNNFLGFGQANIWFADKPEHQKYVNEVFNYINHVEIKKEKVNIDKINFLEDDELNKNINNTIIDKTINFEYTSGLVLKPKALSTKKGIKYYKRDRKKALNALNHANYKCEYNNGHESFIRKIDGLRYTEAHHLIPMAFQDDFEVSLDVEENIVSLCSNCHNEIHYGKNAKELITKLYYERKDILKKNKGIEITLEKLLSYYK